MSREKEEVEQFLSRYKRERTNQVRWHLAKFIKDNQLSSAQATFLQARSGGANFTRRKGARELVKKAMDYFLENEEVAQELFRRYRQERECHLEKWHAKHYPQPLSR